MLLDAWLTRTLPPIRHIINPWLTEGSISMIYGPRGVSKTNVTLALALEIAEGAPFLEFEVPAPRKVLYMDGEMQRGLVRDRLRKFVAHTPRPRALHNLNIINYADCERGIGDLSSPGPGRDLIAKSIDEHEAAVLVLDNKSSLIRTGDENSAEAYMDFNDWLLDLRKWGVTTILVHHAGKRAGDGTLRQRGTSRVEDVMDCIVQLDKAGPAQDGVIPVTWTWEKFRSFTPGEGDESFGLTVRYDDDAGLAWIERVEEPGKEAPEWIEAARGQNDAGVSLRDIGQRFGVSHTTVRRWLVRGTALETPAPSGHGGSAKRTP